MGERTRSRGARAANVLSSLARSERALTLAAALGVGVILLVTLVLPWLDEKRTIATEIPQPAPLFETALVELEPGQQGCANEIGLLPGYQLAQLRVGTFGKPAAPLVLTLTAPGYREVVRLPPTYVDNAVVELPFRGPAKVSEGSVCVTNRGHVRVALYASSDRTRSRSTTLVAGKPYPANFDLAFYAAKPGTWLHHIRPTLDRLRLFHAHFGIGLLWLIAILFLVGVPLASLAALALSSSRGTPARAGAGSARGS